MNRNLPNYFSLISSWAVLCLVFSSSCANRTASSANPPGPAEFTTKDITPAKFSDENNQTVLADIVSGGDGRLLAQFSLQDRSTEQIIERSFAISNDGGKSFGSEHKLARLSGRGAEFASARFVFTNEGLGAVGMRGGNIFFTRSDGDLEVWREPTQINDDQGSFTDSVSLKGLSDSVYYCVWTDGRRGFPLVFFSYSEDGGSTWSHNRPIEHDFREGNQTRPQLVIGEDGRIFVFWEDWRDRQTLVDIRYSYSDDGGRQWSPSRRVNDDREHVWQHDFSVAVWGRTIAVAFTDFRDAGEAGDNDWNIYFSRSSDNGETWEPNSRLNDVAEGEDQSPRLVFDGVGNLHCLWWTGRKSIFGQLAAARSADLGKNWSPSRTLTPAAVLVQNKTLQLVCLGSNRLAASWSEIDYGSETRRLAALETSGVAGPVADETPEPVPVPLRFKIGRTLLTDDFQSEAIGRWQRRNGLWMVADGSLMGVDPSWTEEFASYALLSEPVSYVFKGRFKLDPVNHNIAYLFFRTDPETNKGYLIANHFRRGCWMAVRSGAPVRPHYVGGTVLSQRRYPFQNNRWYDFVLAITPAQADYYVNGELMLSFAGPLALAAGKIGVGGYSAAPTYFDDLLISELEQ